jgi:hypothetical protein
VDRITRNFSEKWLNVAVFLDGAKAFDAVWISGFLYKLMILNFPFLLGPNHPIIPSGLDVSHVLPDGHIISSWHAGWGGAGWFNLPCPFHSVNYMPTPSYHVELALYSDDMAIIATSRKPTLLISYLDSYLSDLQRWLSEWKIAINFLKSTVIIFTRAGHRFTQSWPIKPFREPIQWVDKLVIWE